MVYDALLALFAVGSLPKVLWDRWKKKKKRPTFAERLGLSVPDLKGRPVIWIHAVSVGETKAAQPLFRRLKVRYPDSFFLITNGTATGQAEAKRSMPDADAFAFLPLDFSFIMRRWAKKLRPTHFILIESDFWYNQLRFLKKENTRLILASGKLSERSSARFRKFPFFAKKLFGLFDLLCAQNGEYAARFAPFASKIEVTGNLKLDIEPKPVDLTPYAHLPRPAMTIACTHDPEEREILEALKPLKFLTFLAPRHPERIGSVEQILQNLSIPYILWSQVQKRTNENLILIDSMGQLPICYSLSQFAVVAGSFTDKVGGHNLFEPCQYGCPSLFGPHTYTQKEFTAKILEAKAGLQLPLSELASTLQKLLEKPAFLQEMRAAAAQLSTSNRGAADRTCNLI
ncbi:MAG: 3-deoxy-D-manno-octulosonic acid transferase [Verrucomicrobia bacterium]|nr:3-deoxy-D-manno-octulosonic acid transferase [Verrucomicrobiota bacterium]